MIFHNFLTPSTADGATSVTKYLLTNNQILRSKFK